MAVIGRKREQLTLESILDKVSDYDIYRFYIGHDFALGKPFNSPFRKDDNPSFCVSVTRSGKLHHIDFGDSEKRGDCVDLVMQLLFLDYMGALYRIDLDFGIGNGKVKSSYKRPEFSETTQTQKRVLIQVTSRSFDTADLTYWNSYGISERELKENNVYAVKKLFLDRKRHPLADTDLVFGYLFEDSWKIYRPLAPKREKWLSSVPADRMSGLHRITPGCTKAVITKAKKDEMVLAKFIPNVCSVQNESTVAISKENINLLTGRCGSVFLNFDSDEVGVQSCKYYNQFGFSWVNCPRGYYKPDGGLIKDFADLARYHGLQLVIDHFSKKGII